MNSTSVPLQGATAVAREGSDVARGVGAADDVEDDVDTAAVRQGLDPRLEVVVAVVDRRGGAGR